MKYTTAVSISDVDHFKRKALHWANDRFDTLCFLDSNQYQSYQYAEYEALLAFGGKELIKCSSGTAFESLRAFLNNHQQWVFGFFGYDLKNEVESLSSGNPDQINHPDLFFFRPEYLIEIRKNGEVYIHADIPLAETIIAEIEKSDYFPSVADAPKHALKTRFTREEYISTVQKIKRHIEAGDFYELNFCQEFYAENVDIDPIGVFCELNHLSKAPFSTYLKHDGKHLLSASPERFVKKAGAKIISQPIKGTIRRGKNDLQDQSLADRLKHDPKERSENVMIVDLVRNDLSKSCIPGSVKVEDLFGIKTFEQVHQIVSTISGTVKEGADNIDIIKNAFPMGSMTGTPKVRAMEMIEHYERTKRGLYSGAVGYFRPNGDFDFNVVIRSILYNELKRYLSFQVGSAIVYDSIPEKEYEECLLKAKAMREILCGKETSELALA